MTRTAIANCRVRWTAQGIAADPEWCESVGAAQARIERFLPRLLRDRGLVCPPCRAAGEADGLDAPLCPGASVRYLGAGMWNTAYLVVPCGGHFEELIFRVASPAITRLSKVAAEVATMRWVEDNTVIPVPHVVAYGDDRTNEVGYEWVLIKKATGVPYADVESSLTREQKVEIARTIAEWQHSLACHRFDAIGTPAFGPDGVTPSALGPAVVLTLFACDWRNDYDFPLGPYPDVASFLSAIVECRAQEAADPRQHLRAEYREVSELLAAVERDMRETPRPHTLRLLEYLSHRQAQIEAEAASREELDLAQHPFTPEVPVYTSRFSLAQLQAQQNHLCPRFLPLLDCVFPPSSSGSSSPRTARQTPIHEDLSHFILQHWDINGGNLLVDPATGRPTALLDWEHLYTFPAALCWRHPRLMRSPPPPPPGSGSEDGSEEGSSSESSSRKSSSSTTGSSNSSNSSNSSDHISTPTSSSSSDNSSDNTSNSDSNTDLRYLADCQAMRDALDQRLEELGSPWLAATDCTAPEASGDGWGWGRAEPEASKRDKMMAVARNLFSAVAAQVYEYDEDWVEHLEDEVWKAGFLDGENGEEEGEGEEEDDGWEGWDRIEVGEGSEGEGAGWERIEVAEVEEDDCGDGEAEADGDEDEEAIGLFAMFSPWDLGATVGFGDESR